MNLKEKYGTLALVTGASSGIGEAFAREFAARGLDLVVVARRAERLEALRAELEGAHGVMVTPLTQDLSAWDCGESIAARLAERGLSPDILVNNAGFGQYAEFGSYPLERDLAMVDVNCRAVVDLTHRLLPAMKARRRGAVIIVSSVVAEAPAPWFANYAATKAFDKIFGESLSGELKPHGIDVIASQPTLTETEFHAGSQHKAMPIKYRTSEDVVRTTLAALGRKPSVADGFMAKALLLATRFFTRGGLLRIYKMVRKPE